MLHIHQVRNMTLMIFYLWIL